MISYPNDKLQGLNFWWSRIELVIEVTVWPLDDTKNQFGLYQSFFKAKISTHPNFGQQNLPRLDFRQFRMGISETLYHYIHLNRNPMTSSDR